MDKEVIKEIHHHHYYPYPQYIRQPQRYPGIWHSILPPPIIEPQWYYEPTITTTHLKEVERYDSI